MRRAALVGLALLAGGCDQMARQPRGDVYGPSPLFGNGAIMQPPPAGTVARDAAEQAQALAQRPPMTAELLARGRDRYAVFCRPCHDPAGYGQGAVPARGYPPPPSFHEEPLLSAPSQRFVDAISNGYGVMYAYGDRIPPRDRWAIVAYIRALQLSQAAPVARLSNDDRRRLEASHGG